MTGSSPLARGTLFQQLQKVHRVGLIPARAGNTPWKKLRRTVTKAHPRSRGEHGYGGVPLQ